MTRPLSTAVNASYEAGRQIAMAAELDDGNHARRDQCLDKAEDELRLALRLIGEFREAGRAAAVPTYSPIFTDIFAAFGVIPAAQAAPIQTREAA